MSKMNTSAEDLKSAAVGLLKKYPAVEVAAKHFVMLIERDEELRTALALLYLKDLMPKTLHGRRRTGKHRRVAASISNNRMPTKSQREASLKARSGIADVVFARKLRGGRVLGELHVRELRAMTQTQLETSMRFLNNSYVDLVDFVALQRIDRHCGAADPDLLVKDCIKSAVVTEIFQQAEVVAAEALRDGTEKFAAAVIEIANRSETRALQ
jgi:hypothetical protein